MGTFWEEFQTTNGLQFVKAEEKNVLIDDATPLVISRVFKAQSKFGPRYIVVTAVDGEERAIGFAAGTVESRDNMFDALMGYLEREDAELPVVVMKRYGRAVVLEHA